MRQKPLPADDNISTITSGGPSAEFGIAVERLRSSASQAS